MYEQYFGLKAKPFSLLPEASSLFPSKRHQHIVNILEYGIETQAGFVVITGDVGAGKTTVLGHFLKNLPKNVTVGMITNPNRRLGSLLNWVSNAFDLPQHDNDEAKMYNSFVEFLLQQYAKGLRTMLIIDEAQNLTADVLEELRMLSNVNNSQDMLLQMVLAGQPELLETLNRSDLRQFVQRIGAHGHLTALSPKETADYIHHRLQVAGARRPIFDQRACAGVHYFSGGVPRLINQLCDQSLIYAFAEDRAEVGFETVAEVVSDKNSTGLSPFAAVVAGKSNDQILDELQVILQEMQSS